MSNSSLFTWFLAAAGFIAAAFLVYKFRGSLSRKTGLIDGPIGRGIVRFTLPLLIGNVFQQFYSMVDAMIVGQYVGKNALGAVGPSSLVFYLMIALIIGITMGAGIIIAQYFGAKRYEDLKKAIDTVYVFSFVAGLILMIAGYILTPYLLQLLKTPPEIFDGAVSYLRILFLGIVFTFGFNAVSGVLRGVGDSITPLIFLIVTTAINVVLDLVFVLYFKMGVAGAAWATVIAQAISLIVALIYVNSLKERYLRFSVANIKFDSAIFALMIRVGLPSGLQQTLVSISLLFLTSLVNSYGADATAAFSAVGRLDSFIVLPGINFGMAISTFVGQNLGAGKINRLKKGLRVTCGIGFGFVALVVAFLIPFRKELLMLFINRDEVGALAVGSRFFEVIGLFYPIGTLMFIFSGAIRGAGKTLETLVISIITLVLFRIPAAYFFNAKLGLDGVWLVFGISWVFGALLSFVYWYGGKWKSGLGIAKSRNEPRSAQGLQQ